MPWPGRRAKTHYCGHRGQACPEHLCSSEGQGVLTGRRATGSSIASWEVLVGLLCFLLRLHGHRSGKGRFMPSCSPKGRGGVG